MALSTDYLLIGHITADITEAGHLLGGPPSYAAATAHALGLNVTVLTSAMPDDPLLDTLRHFANVVVIPSDETTTYRNIYVGQARRQLLREIAAPITLEDVKKHQLSAPLVHIAPMAAEVDPSITQYFADSTVLLTPQGWMRRRDALDSVYFHPWFDEESVHAADFVVFSEEDMAPDPALHQRFIQESPRLIITDGENGGTYAESGKMGHYNAFPANVTEVTGAGDVFASSLLVGWQRYNDFGLAIELAARLAAISVTRVGLEGTPTPDEVKSVFDAIEKSKK